MTRVNALVSRIAASQIDASALSLLLDAVIPVGCCINATAEKLI
jgi:hypothetical protein